MFFVSYLRRELRSRIRQAIFIALGLALGVGLVVVVGAASAGVKTAQAKELAVLYGVGTAVTVTGASDSAPKSPPPGAEHIQEGPNGQPEICSDGTCTSAAGKTIDNLLSPDSGISTSKVAAIAGLHDVTAAAGGIKLIDATISFPASGIGGSMMPTTYTLDGVDTSNPSLGPLSGASLTSGHSFTAAESDSDVAVVDSDYAASKGLKVGSAITIHNAKFTVIGIVRQ
jgi:ABC-type antimicrobial peptide transport system permease subunit